MHGTSAGQPLPSEPIRMMTVWQKQSAGWMEIAHSVLGPEKTVRNEIAADPEINLGKFPRNEYLAIPSGDNWKFDALATRRWRQRLLHWYDHNRRDLPWRRDRDPYRVWISEIMLQQTRVSAVLEHYRRFLQRFPTVQKLAAAREPAVLAAWSGLGYYRRARMMHAAAKVIVKEHGRKVS